MRGVLSSHQDKTKWNRGVVPPSRHQLRKKQWNRGVGGRGYRLQDFSCTRNNGQGSRGKGYRLPDISCTRNNGQGSRGKGVPSPRLQLYKKQWNIEEQVEGGTVSQTSAVLAVYAPMICTALCVMLLMRAASITRASGRGLAPGNRDFFGPCEMAIS